MKVLFFRLALAAILVKFVPLAGDSTSPDAGGTGGAATGTPSPNESSPVPEMGILFSNR